MTKKNNREQRLLLTLSKKQDYVTAEELAEQLQTSTKTIYRLIKKINQGVKESPLILSEKGRGYQLNYEKYISQKNWTVEEDDAYSPNERRMRVLEELLLSSPKARNLYDLFEDYYVGDSVITSDEQLIAKQLKEYDLTLERKNRTLAVTGAENDIRRALADLIPTFNTIDLDELESVKASNLNNYDVLFVIRELRGIEKALSITIPYPYNINIFSHLYILISRFRKVGALKNQTMNELTAKETAELQHNTQLQQVSKKVIENVENYLHQPLPEIEVYYLYQYLLSSRMQGKPAGSAANFSAKVVQITQAYLTEMGRRLQIATQNEVNFLDLASHIKPMVNRLEHKIRVKNGLLDQIRLTYEDIFREVTGVSKQISQTYALPAINQDENGFLTLYFARMLETNQRPIKTIIMCTTGVGTSELLKTKVEKKFPELEIIDVTASRYSQEKLAVHPDADLILTTVQLPADLPVQSLLVSAMLTVDDQKRIQQKIEAINHGK
ncbi:BglG family transcription antiterminator [Enterococcus sp. CSURQ0835]|uniref:BglG family transcription antiterminator n=1 Tax=Enterococcus sp. CSURQ0835 TaxID=2681394 RepID=UPI001358FBA7|nr:PRD domain-containing protein [Enterococcus sp. CSURQ0835]